MKKSLWIAASLTVLAFFLSGCAQPMFGNKPGASDTKTANADLKTIRVAESGMETPVSDGVTDYEVYTSADTSTATVTAVTDDPEATVTYDTPDAGKMVIGDGLNKLSMTVTSRDGSAKKTYTVKVIRCTETAVLSVLDSVNGSLLPAKGISYRVYKYGFLVGYLKATANPQHVYLLPGVSFRIVASAANRASCALEEVTAKPEGNQYWFVCQKQGMSTFPAVSPTIKAVQKTVAADPSATAESEWVDVKSGSDLDLAAVTGFRVKVEGYSVMEPTSWSGAGVQLDFDNVPGTFNGLDASSTVNSYDKRSHTFKATAIFDYAGMQLLPGAHSMDIVIYDRANNRVERNIPVNVVSVPDDGADISACAFTALTADIRTYGVSREYFRISDPRARTMEALTSGGTSYRINVTFKFLTPGNANQSILGFVVKRSDDGGITYETAGSVNYGALSTGAAGTHGFYDVTPGLGTGTAYSYKVEAFTDSVHKLESAAIAGTLIPAFTSSLVSPAHGAKNVDFDNAAGTGPDFVFSVSDPSLWSPAAADYFYFAPILRQKSGTIDFYGEFRYKLATDALQFKYGSGWYDVVANFGGAISDYIAFRNGEITCKSLLFALGYTNMYNGSPVAYSSGLTYEWDIFGSYNSAAGNLASPTAMTSSWFQKTAGGTLCRSYSDVYQNGQQTLNGWFEFTAK